MATEDPSIHAQQRQLIETLLSAGNDDCLFAPKRDYVEYDERGNLTIITLVFPQQASTSAAPEYVKGALYFDTTLNKLMVGGASAWETVTSSTSE